MDDHDFDRALIAAAFICAARDGWHAVTVAAAARQAGLPLDRARERFAGTAAILLKFGRLADQAALSETPESGPVRERLFDVVMRRFDALQQHRPGMLALLHALPTDPGTALLLAAATRTSMGWMLEAAGAATSGWRGGIAVQGMVGVWLFALRAWARDDSPDLAGTMAALDRALARVEGVAGWLDPALGSQDGSPGGSSGPKPFPDAVPGDPIIQQGV